MSLEHYFFVLSEKNSVLTSVIDPPLQLNENDQYVLGFLNFVSYNMIPNVDEMNNKFHIADKTIEIPEGTYEIKDIEKYVIKKISIAYKDAPKIPFVSIKVNMNTLKCEIKSVLDVHLDRPDSIGPLLGFTKRKLVANQKHESDNPINISKVNAICVECNIITNSFRNGKPVHILHSFTPKVNPGYKIEESPLNIIYLPINTRYINEIIIKIVDQDGKLINFNNELITVSLHLKSMK